MRGLLGVATACVALLLAGAAGAQGLLGTWTTGTPLPTARSEDSVAVAGTTIYVIGGYAAAGGSLDSTGRIDVDQPLVQATGAAVAGDALYVPAGAPVNGGSRQSDTLFVFRQS